MTSLSVEALVCVEDADSHPQLEHARRPKNVTGALRANDAGCSFETGTFLAMGATTKPSSLQDFDQQTSRSPCSANNRSDVSLVLWYRRARKKQQLESGLFVQADSIYLEHCH